MNSIKLTFFEYINKIIFFFRTKNFKNLILKYLKTLHQNIKNIKILFDNLLEFYIANNIPKKACSSHLQISQIMIANLSVHHITSKKNCSKI